MTKMITAAIVAVAVTGFAVPQAPAQTHGQKPSEGLGHMEHRFDDPERYAKEFNDLGRDTAAGEQVAPVGQSVDATHTGV